MTLNKFRKEYGPLSQVLDSEIASLLRVSERAWELFAISFDSAAKGKDQIMADLISKLVYHGQNCSYSIGLLSTWGQPLEALILLRTRYEQLITSSYLIHAPKVDGFDLFQKQIHRMDLNTLRKMRLEAAPLYQMLNKIIGKKIQSAEMEAIKKEQESNPSYSPDQKLPDCWSPKSKLLIVRERDKYAKDKHEISSSPLENYYHSLYRHSTGIAHADPSILTNNYISIAPDGISLMPSVFQIYLNLIQCASFDIIQSFESVKYFDLVNIAEYDKLNEEYKNTMLNIYEKDMFNNIF